MNYKNNKMKILYLILLKKKLAFNANIVTKEVLLQKLIAKNAVKTNFIKLT